MAHKGRQLSGSYKEETRGYLEYAETHLSVGRVEAARQEGRPRRPVVSRLTRILGPVNVAGLAALSVPCAVGAGLPVGLQLIGRDRTLFGFRQVCS